VENSLSLAFPCFSVSATIGGRGSYFLGLGIRVHPPRGIASLGVSWGRDWAEVIRVPARALRVPCWGICIPTILRECEM
jgi:hypothetical protein